MKILPLLLLLCLVFAQDADAADSGDKKSFTLYTKKAKRRTGAEVLKEIQSTRKDVVNLIIFQKESQTNAVSSKENPKEVAMYEKFFKNLDAGWDGCTANQDFVVDLIEVTDPLAEELLLKLKINKDKQFEKRTMGVALKKGSGVEVQGPTFYDRLIKEIGDEGEKWVEGETCADAFFEKEETTDDAAATDGDSS